MSELTSKELCLEFIKRYSAEHGRPPGAFSIFEAGMISASGPGPTATQESAVVALQECLINGYGLRVEDVDAQRLVKIILRNGIGAGIPPDGAPSMPSSTHEPGTVPAAHREGSEPLSRIMGDIDYCLAHINPQHQVHVVLTRVGEQLLAMSSTQPPRVCDECGAVQGEHVERHWKGCSK